MAAQWCQPLLWRHRHGMRRWSMREKLTFRMAFARAAHACTKRDAQAYLEQFHQPRTTCAVAQRSATKPLYATFARQQQLCNFIGRGDCKIAPSSHQWYRGDQCAKGSSSSAYSELPCAAARRRAPSSESPSEASSEKVGRANFCECNVCNGSKKWGLLLDRPRPSFRR